MGEARIQWELEQFRDKAMSSQEEYMKTVARIEPDITPLDSDGSLASIAISLKRIADAQERVANILEDTNDHGERGFRLIYRAIVDGFTFTGGPPRG